MVSTKNRLKDNLIGDKAFYKKVMLIIIPIIIQTTITSVVNLIDNIMVGRVGTLEMSSVAIINQLIVVFNLCIFGGLSGAGIFATQFAGAKDVDGVRYCFRMKIYICLTVLAISTVVFTVIPEQLVRLYIAEGTSAADEAATIRFATSYLKIIIIGLIPFSFSQIYSSALREIGETKIPMYGSVVAICLNTLLNFLLIFGMCGFPQLGVIGAAIATVVSRFCEMLLIVILAHIKRNKFTFLKGVYRSFKIPATIWQGILKKGLPILVNEFLWSMGTAMYLQCYSVRGLDVVASVNIAATVTTIFNVLFIASGNAVAIMVGQCLGANDIEGAKKTVWRLIAFSFAGCTIMGAILAMVSGIIPEIYNTDTYVKQLASSFLIVSAVIMPVASFTHNCYFTIRSGGKTFVTFLFDSGFMWVVGVPVAYILANYTQINIVTVYFCVNAVEMLKAILAFILVKNGVWINNIVR